MAIEKIRNYIPKDVEKLVEIGNLLADTLEQHYSSNEKPKILKQWDKQVNKVYKQSVVFSKGK